MRDFLTCVASPDGHRVAFSYQRAWFPEKLLAAGLDGRPAVIVFCDAETPTSDFHFISLRHVTIEELVPAAPRNVPGNTAITLVFRLGSFVAASDGTMEELQTSWQQSLGELDYRPRPKDHPEAEKALFVFEHPELEEAPGEPDPKESWRVLSTALGRCGTLEDAFFFRVGSLRAAKEGQALNSAAVGSLAHVYPLTPSSEYELPMDAYSKSGKTPYSDAIAVASSSPEQLSVQAVTQSSAGRASEAVLVLRAGEVKRAQIATLIIQGAKGFEHLVPRVEIATQIKPKMWLAVLLTLVIAIGVVLGGLPTDAFGLPQGVVYVLKGLGGLIVGLVTLIALGRVPGVGK